MAARKGYECPHGHPHFCGDCQRESARRYYHKNRDTEVARNRARRLVQPDDPEKRRARLLRQYGLTPEDVEAMTRAQGGRCALCGAETRLVIDHDHTTGTVRGLLCNACNTGLGKLGDSVAGLMRAVAYLQGTRRLEEVG
ncbi:MAG: endonuclease VII domain-containing protein [Mycobacteriaceae bacterium]